VKSLLTVVAACVLGSLILTSCAKSTSSEGANAAASGPVSDMDNSGLKPTGAPAVVMGDPKHGRDIFKQNCASCHGAAGAGGGIGPVLKGEKHRKNYAAAIAWIENPQPPMPKLYPSPLSLSDVQDVAAYVESL
jgi:mono/diheme cytochrome c family protein